MSENIDILLTEFGVPCSFGRVDFVGLVDKPDRDLDFGSPGVRVHDYTLTFRTGAVVLKDGDTVFVDVEDGGAPIQCKVRSPRAIDDGKLTEVGLLT